MKNSVTPKLLFYGVLLFGILLAMILDSCIKGPEIIVEVPIEAIGPDTINYQVQGIKNDNTVILRNLSTGSTMLMVVENPYSQAYETGLLITLIQ
ncbi:MAG TPA: hypothetical protein ENH85_06960 [Candidatus Scalindua sp.]|nr:hypothetical protein [Candidatus Scalindua sp.]